MEQTINGNGFPMVVKKTMRNSPCSCGSGKKQKHCCGAGSEFYYSKLSEKQENELMLKKEAETKAAEVRIKQMLDGAVNR